MATTGCLEWQEVDSGAASTKEACRYDLGIGAFS